ncbi:ABC transporter substrate-binding protein [Ignatzschineria larvae DSM 13226]|uniref:ABC transporter substrate-binding protein n=1 Tax=Ignatzschineria larvae DSM 13226 TaxID=1111732 RepID=A0ABZ3BY22_9GAMM|nr:ABC transporter substrate-binding protein [Ignatzschineria larvae]
MKRRSFIKTAGTTAALSGVIAASSISRADSLPKIRWRLTAGFPKNLDILFAASTMLADKLARLTNGQFEIQVFAPGELVPANQVFDAVSQGTVEIGHTASYYYHGKNSALSIDTVLPFGMSARMQNAWFYAGGGLEILRKVFAQYNIINFPGGNTTAQMGGWFRKEVKTLEDLKGLKFRIPGFGGEILSRLGVIPQSIPASDVYSSLEKGTIDAAEFVGPYDDEKLGLQSVAPYYYTPGFWEGSATTSFYVNQDKWQELPPLYQELFTTVCAEINQWMIAQYDAKNPPALATLTQNGAKLRSFSKEILEASYNVAQKIYEEECNKNPDFKMVYDHWRAFLNQEYQWFRINENIFQSFMASQIRKQNR